MINIKQAMRSLILVLTGWAFFAGAGSAAEISRSICIWDLSGATGPVTNMLREVKVYSLRHGVDLTIHAFTDEKVATEWFKAGQCDAAAISEIAVREFNQFTSTLGAIGALPRNEDLELVLRTLTQPKAGKLLVQGEYEIAGFIPMGTVFMFLRNRDHFPIGNLAGRRISVLDNDPVNHAWVNQVGGSPVPANLSTFAAKFNNGNVEVTFAPAIAYSLMELSKGLRDQGGILRKRLLQAMIQVVIRHERFPEGFGQKIREDMMEQFEDYMRLAVSEETAIPDHVWVKPGHVVSRDYDRKLIALRMQLKEAGIYDSKALHLMKKVRCRSQPQKGECSRMDE